MEPEAGRTRTCSSTETRCKDPRPPRPGTGTAARGVYRAGGAHAESPALRPARRYPSLTANEPLPRIFDATLAEEAKTAELSTAELKAILETKSALVLDARPRGEFGIGHIPGAVNVPGKPGLPSSEYTADRWTIGALVKGL